MNVRNDLAAPRLNVQLPTPKPAAPAAERPAPADQFEGARGAQAATRVALAGPGGDDGKLMRDYLTGAAPPPADFEKVMGYAPVRVQMPYGTRMQDPFGDASSPGKIGPVEDFDPMAKTHDYGYDLLRYYAKKGTPLGPDARKAADQMFRDDLFSHANAKPGLVERWKSRAWAQIFATAVELNSRRQGYGPP